MHWGLCTWVRIILQTTVNLQKHITVGTKAKKPVPVCNLLLQDYYLWTHPGSHSVKLTTLRQCVAIKTAICIHIIHKKKDIVRRQALVVWRLHRSCDDLQNTMKAAWHKDTKMTTNKWVITVNSPSCTPHFWHLTFYNIHWFPQSSTNNGDSKWVVMICSATKSWCTPLWPAKEDLYGYSRKCMLTRHFQHSMTHLKRTLQDHQV